MICKQCKYFKSFNGSPDGTCMRYPPQLVVYIHPDVGPSFETHFPVTNNDSYCGEYNSRIK